MFKLPESFKTTIENYRGSLNDYLEGKISGDRFRGIRVPFGFYSERETNVLLSRVRIPGGCATSDQLKALAQAARKFKASIHITDRQDVQLHDVTYEDSAEVLEFLKAYEMSSIGGGGNTVRNVTACPLSGICKDELFDCRSHAIAVSEYLLNDPLAIGRLPRKFKVAFSGCATDCAYGLINDVGLIAKERDGVRGFKVYSGGGLGASSAVCQVLEEFVPEEKIGYIVKAVMLTYEKYGDKFNRHRNRMRFLVEQLGFERFRELYRELLAQVLENETFSHRPIQFKGKFRAVETVSLNQPEAGEREFASFVKNNLKPQKPEGYYAVELDIAQGDISDERLEQLAGLETIIPEIEFRFTHRQNILLCNIPGTEITDIYQRLKKIFNGPGFVITEDILNIVACKGATTCNLGLCHSPGLSRVIIKELTTAGLDLESLKEFGLKISGCPNNCGQHSIGVIGLQGITRKVNLRPIPLYKVLAGGRTGENSTRLSQELGKVPAKVVPQFLKEFFSIAQHKIKAYPSVYEFLEHEGTEILKSLTDKYSYIPSYEERPDFYKDWERTEDFTLAGLGPAECGAGVLDLIAADLADADSSLKQAKASGHKAEQIKNALVYAARALQVVRGLEPKNDQEVVASFIKEFIDKGIADKGLAEIAPYFDKLQKELTEAERLEAYAFAERFYSAITELNKQMDSHFKFPSEKKKEEPKPVEAGNMLDLKGVKCPINYVKAKLFLEGMEEGEVVTLLVDDGEPIRNVPNSLMNDGHEILEKERVNGHYRLVVKK